MQKLVDGLHHFQNHVFSSQREFFERLAMGQHPVACFITCADSRIDPNLITNTDPGELFIVRNVGNIVPPHGTSNNGEAAAIEFAVVGLGVKDIIICGHTGCGAMSGLVASEGLVQMPGVRDWLRHADAAQQIVRENYADLRGEALLTAAAEENVLVQVEHLRTLPAVAARLARGKVVLHAWMYKIETGEMFEFDAASRQFVPFGARQPASQT
jgi:carbonic anhydrase